MAEEGALEGKESYIRKIDEESESEISNINIQQSDLNKDQLLKEYITYLGGVSYELIITSDNMFDNSLENFCDKYSNVLNCETKYITNHGSC